MASSEVLLDQHFPTFTVLLLAQVGMGCHGFDFILQSDVHQDIHGKVLDVGNIWWKQFGKVFFELFLLAMEDFLSN